MAGNVLPDSFINPALERAQRVEHAMSQVAKVVELELSDISLGYDDIDDETKQQLRNLGSTFVRLSTLGISVANDIAGALGEEKIEFTLGSQPKLPQEQETARPQLPTAKPALLPEVPTVPHLVPAPPIDHAAVHVNGNGHANGNGHKATEFSSGRLDRSQNDQQPVVTVPERLGRAKRQFEGELYEMILPASRTPLMALREGMEPINITISSDDTLRIDGKEFPLEGDRLFIFNAVMRMRDSFITPKEIRALGFRPGTSETAASQAFSKTMMGLSVDLKKAASIELIKKIGDRRHTRYGVNPAIVLVDERETTSAPAEQKKN